MRSLLRFIGILSLLALVTSSLSLSAQDDNITVVGSAIVEPVFNALAAASETAVNLSITGTSTGFNTFCQGEADITLANRTITSAEIENCASGEVEFVELLIGHNINAIISSPDMEAAQCLSLDELNTIFAPSTTGAVTNWNQVFLDDGPDLPLAIYVPEEISPAYAIMDRIIEGDGLRRDAVVQDTPGIISSVSGTNGALGIIRLADLTDSVMTLELDAGDIPGCYPPSAENVEDNLYPAADQLYLYVSAASLDKTIVSDFINFVIGEEAPSIVEGTGFTAPTNAAYEMNRQALESGITGQPIPRASDDFTLPTNIVGEVVINGSAGAYNFIKTVSDNFGAANTGITMNLSLRGEPAGFRSLCNGEADIVTAYRDLTSEEAANCEANNIDLFEAPLATETVILVANGATDYLSCLALGDIAAAWAGAETVPTNWNAVNPAFADTAITLFAPRPGDKEADTLMIAAAGTAQALRVDTQQNNDPLYRAAATANVEGALTYMSWQDYQRVVNNNQQNIQLVAVGDDCVTPSIETITNQTYPLTRSIRLLANQELMAQPEVQAFLWSLYSNENYPLFDVNGLIGLRFGDLPQIRANLQTAFAQAEAAAAQAAAEATPEATAEAEATEEASE